MSKSLEEVNQSVLTQNKTTTIRTRTEKHILHDDNIETRVHLSNNSRKFQKKC